MRSQRLATSCKNATWLGLFGISLTTVYNGDTSGLADIKSAQGISQGKEVRVTTYNAGDVRHFVSNLNDQFCQCQNGEGMECATLDTKLCHLTLLCSDFMEGLRNWGRDIFARRAEYDSSVEEAWLVGGRQLLRSARRIWGDAKAVEVECYVLESQELLVLAIFEMEQLLNHWVSPKPSVGPSARLGSNLSQSVVDEARRRIESLPLLPAEWRADGSQICAS